MSRKHVLAGTVVVVLSGLSLTQVSAFGHSANVAARSSRPAAAGARIAVGDLKITLPLGLGCIDVGAIGCQGGAVDVSTGGPASGNQVAVSGNNVADTPTTANIAISNAPAADGKTVAVSVGNSAFACGGPETVAISVSGFLNHDPQSASSCPGTLPGPGFETDGISINGDRGGPGPVIR